MAQNVSHCIFCSDLFHPKSLPCSAISSIRCIIHPVCPFCQNMLQASQKKCLTGSFQPVMVSGLFIVSRTGYPDYRSFPILIVFLCPCFLPFFTGALCSLGRINFFLTLSGFVPSVLIYRNFPLYTSGTCSLTPLRSFIGFSGSRASSRYNVHLEKP